MGWVGGGRALNHITALCTGAEVELNLLHLKEVLKMLSTHGEGGGEKQHLRRPPDICTTLDLLQQKKENDNCTVILSCRRNTSRSELTLTVTH